jgi:hypothetical protein
VTGFNDALNIDAGPRAQRVPNEVRQVKQECLEEQDCWNPLIIGHVHMLTVGPLDFLFVRNIFVVRQVIRVSYPAVAV